MTVAGGGRCGLHPDATCGELVHATQLNDHDRAALGRGCHFDYRAQVWKDGHDHAHRCADAPDVGLLYCGADLATCTTGDGDPPAA